MKRLFVDMDGTLAKFSFVSNEKLHEKGYFKNLEPIKNVVDAVKKLVNADNGIEVFTMSAVLEDSQYAISEKDTWLDNHLPEIDSKHRIYVPCGHNKKDYLPDGIQEQDYLLDDFTENLNAWLPNMGIKILNGINNTKDTWKGNKISCEKEPLQIATDIVDVIERKRIVRDEPPQNEKIREKEKTYRYYVTQRPIDIGTIPRTKDSINITAFEDRQEVEEIGRSAYGFVEYREPLSDEEVRDYELATAVGQRESMEQEQFVSLEQADIPPLDGEEKFVYVTRMKGRGEYHVGWTGNLVKTLNEMPDKDKVLGCFIVPDRVIATSLKNYLNKLSHINVETMLLYPERLQKYYEKADMVENVDVTKLNEVLKLNTDAIVRSFPFAHSNIDMVNEIYNKTINKTGKKLSDYMQDFSNPDVRTLRELADKAIANRVKIMEKAVEKGIAYQDIELLITPDISNEDYMKYSKEQMEYLVEHGVNALVYDDMENPTFTDKEAFQNIMSDIPEGAQVQYFKDGLHGRYYMQVVRKDGKADLYTLSNLSVFLEEQPVLTDFEVGQNVRERMQEIVGKYRELKEDSDSIKDEVLAGEIISFAGNGQLMKEDIILMLQNAERQKLWQIIDTATKEDEDSKIKATHLKTLVLYNEKNFNRKNIEQYIAQLKEDKSVISNIPEYITGNIENLRRITKEVAGTLRYLPEIAKNDIECVKNAVENQAEDYQFVSDELKKNEEIARIALKADNNMLAYMPQGVLERLRKKSLFDVTQPDVSGISIEKCLSVYGYVEDNISLNPILRYSEKSKEQQEAVFDALEEKWNGEENALAREEKTAVLKLRRTDENQERMGLSFMELAMEKGELPDLKNYEIVYIDNTYTASSKDISGLFRKANGDEKSDHFYETGMEIGDIVITTKNGTDFELYYVDMENSIRPSELIDEHTKRKINDNIDVRIEIGLLRKFKEAGILDETYAERLEKLEELYADFFTKNVQKAEEKVQESDIELTQEEKNELGKLDAVEADQNILPKDRMTYKKDDGEVILKKDAVLDKEELQKRTAELYQKDEVIKSLPNTYAIESSDDYPDMLQEYEPDEIKEGTNYRLVQIDSISGKLVKVNELLFSSQEIAERFFEKEIYNPSISKTTGQAAKRLVSYDSLVYKAFEVSNVKKGNELLQGIQNVLDSDKFKGWCTARANQFYKKYSINNSLAIFFQNPNASIVYGARQWQELGRQVKKGEKAMKITIPCHYAYQKNKGGLMNVIKKGIQEQIRSGKDYGVYRLGESNLTFVGSKNGLYSMLINDQVFLSNIDEMSLARYIDTKVIGKVPVAFTSVNIFDISQVEEPEFLFIRNLKEEDKADLVKDEKGEPVRTRAGAYKVRNTPERRAKLNTVLDMQIHDEKDLNTDGLYGTLKRISEKHGVPVVEKELPDGVNGSYNRKEELISIDENLSSTHKVKTCIHEMAHSRMHKSGVNMPTRLMEIQAEAVSYIVNKSLGLDTDSFSFNYIASWTGSRRMSEIKQSLDLINDEAAALYDEIVKDMNDRGIPLKKNEEEREDSEKENKEKKPEIEEKREKGRKEQRTFAADLLELQEQYETRLKKARERLEKETDTKMADMFDDICNSYNRILNECSQMDTVSQKIKDELDQEIPDFDKINEYNIQLNKCAERINVSREDVDTIKKHIKDYTEMLDKENALDISKSEFEKFREDYENNPKKAMKQLSKRYPDLKELGKTQLQYLAASSFIREQLQNLPPENGMENFIALCMVQTSNIEKIKSEKGNVFVEIVDSDYADLEKGSVMHIKVAEKQISAIEKGMRKTREEALKRKELIPAVNVVLNVYAQSETGNIVSLSNFSLKLGTKKQDGLISAIEHRCERYPKYKKFVNDCKEAGKEMDVFKKKSGSLTPDLTDIIRQANLMQYKKERESKEQEQDEEKEGELPEIEVGSYMQNQGHKHSYDRSYEPVAGQSTERLNMAVESGREDR